METINTLVVENSILSDISSVPHLYLEDGLQRSTYYAYNANSNSNSSLNWAFPSPGYGQVLDRNPLISTGINLTLNLTGVPVGQKAFQLGDTDAIQSFIFNKLCNQSSSTINNEQSSFSNQYYIDEVIRTANPKILGKYNSFCATFSDQKWGMYKDAVGTNSNPLASSNNSSYDAIEPRGAFTNITFLNIDHYIAGVYTDSSVISTATTDTWIISLQIQSVEPLIGLAPFDWEMSEMNRGGLMGINNIALQFTIDTGCSRAWSTANTTTDLTNNVLTSYITSIGLGLNVYKSNTPPTGSTPIINTAGALSTTTTGFVAPKLLMNWVTPNSFQLSKMKGFQNCHSYVEYTPYITTSGTAIASGATGSITSNSVNLSHVPSRIYVFARIPASTKNQWNYTKSYLALQSISIIFANSAGILSELTIPQLWRLSQKNGSNQSYEEFIGNLMVNDNTNGGISAKPSLGSLLVLDPMRDFSIPSEAISNGSTGQFQMQITCSFKNQFPFAISPEMLIVTSVDGIFQLDDGTAKKFIGNVSDTIVLQAKQKSDTISSAEFNKMTGGSSSTRIGLVRKLFHKKQKRGGQSAGGQSAGSMPSFSGGAVNRLQKHLR